MFLNNLMALTVGLHGEPESLHTFQKIMFYFFAPLKNFNFHFLSQIVID